MGKKSATDVSQRIFTENKCASEMIQCAPEILQNIPNHKWPFLGDGVHDFGEINSVLRPRVIVSDVTIGAGLVEGFEAGFKIADVLFGPFDFRP